MVESAFMNSVLLLTLLSLPAMAAMTTKKVTWELEKTKFEGVLVYDDGSPR